LNHVHVKFLIDILNRKETNEDELQKRVRLDRRRIESAHLRYAVLRLQQAYQDTFPAKIPMSSNIEDTLEKILPMFYQSFIKKLSGKFLFHLTTFLMITEHECHYAGCTNVLVLDGNMKNRRDICYAKDAGYVRYPGLDGHIKTGCMMSPAYKSYFCEKHKDRSCSKQA
jgi:hypothetical protein